MTSSLIIAGNNFGDTRTGGLAGPMALLIVALLALATVLLIRNMSKRIRRLPERFPAPGESGAGDATLSNPDGSGRIGAATDEPLTGLDRDRPRWSPPVDGRESATPAD